MLAYRGAIKEPDFDKPLDREGRSTNRVEQSYLRKYLFKNRQYGKCGICDREYPVEFLVAAHIKKRKTCTDEEKKDKHIVMPMCKFGCDDLYENGYIIVFNGRINENEKMHTTPYMKKYLEEISNNECRYYNEKSKKYFDWHLEYHSNI